MTVLIAVSVAVLSILPSEFCVQDRSAGEIRDLIARLGHAEFAEREEAELEILRVGKAAIPFLEEARKHEDPEVQSRAQAVLEVMPFVALIGAEGARRFGRTYGLDRVDVVVGMDTEDLEEELGRQVADAILEGFPWREEYVDSKHQRDLFDLREKIKAGPRALSWVFVRMMEHDHKYVRLHGVAGLKEMDARERAPFVARVLGDPHHYVRLRAVQTLAQFGAREYAADIERRVTDEDESVRWNAALAVEQFTGSHEAIVVMLRDADEKVRQQAAWFLDQTDDKGAVGALTEALEVEQNKGVVQGMESALRSLEGLKGERRHLEVLHQWRGADSRIEERTYLRIRDTEGWKKVRERHSDEEVPAIDFSEQEVIAIFTGKGWNSKGVIVSSLSEDDAVIRLRYDEVYYQTKGPDGGGQEVTSFGIVVIPRSDKPVIIEQDMQGLKGYPPYFEERARLD